MAPKTGRPWPALPAINSQFFAKGMGASESHNTWRYILAPIFKGLLTLVGSLITPDDFLINAWGPAP